MATEESVAAPAWQNRITGHGLEDPQRLLANPKNWRIHPDEQKDALAKVMDKVGWVQEIVCNQRSGFIVDGHLRVALAISRGERVPVSYVDLTPAEEDLILATFDSITVMAVPDAEKLAALMSQVSTEFPDLAEMLESIRANGQEEPPAQPGLTDEDSTPAPPEAPVTVLGDVWLMGDHRLVCGDATHPDSVGTAMEGQPAAMAFTDPPYNVDYVGKTSQKLRIGNDSLGGQFYDFLRAACANLLAVTQGAIYICMSSSELHTLFRAFTDAGGHWSTFVIWAKHHFTLGRSDYQRMYEPILYGWRNGAEHFWCGDRSQGDVWAINRPAASVDHPTMKPVELVERAIRNSSQHRDIVLDPFAGSGTTLIACEKAGRLARLVEIDPRYCDVIIRRWQEFTGRLAVHQGTGLEFPRLAVERAAAVVA